MVRFLLFDTHKCFIFYNNDRSKTNIEDATADVWLLETISWVLATMTLWQQQMFGFWKQLVGFLATMSQALWHRYTYVV